MSRRPLAEQPDDVEARVVWQQLLSSSLPAAVADWALEQEIFDAYAGFVPGDAAPASVHRTEAQDDSDIRTFLIADVRGYTRFTQEHGDDAGASLAAGFAARVREVVEAFGGDLIELRGDEALAVFSSARQALRSSVELQARFRASDSGFPLGIGIGLDAGEAVPVAGGFRGGALNLAARLCSIAGSGEILATETVTSLARRVEGVRVKERRAVRLKGLERPVRVHEVMAETPLPPPPGPTRQHRRVSRQAVAFALLALAVLAASLGVYALTSREAEGLPRLEENTIGLVDTDSNRIMAQVPLDSPADGITAGGGMGVGRQCSRRHRLPYRPPLARCPDDRCRRWPRRSCFWGWVPLGRK